MRYWIFLVFFLFGVQTVFSQSYYSKLLFRGDFGTSGGSIFEFDEEQFLIDIVSRESGNLQLGWYLLNGDGEKVDSFFYYTPNLSSGGTGLNNMVYRNDTIFQMRRPKFDHNLEANIYGSSLSDKDSLLRWRYDWSDWGYTWVDPSSMVETSEGHFLMILTGYTAQPRDFFVLGMMIDSRGEEIWRKEIYRFPKENLGSIIDLHLLSEVIELDGYFYYLGVYWDGNKESLVQKIDSEGRLIWSFEEILYSGGYTSNKFRDLSLGPDSATIAFGSVRQLTPEELEDFEPDFFDRYSKFPPTITYLDTLDGKIVDEVREYSPKSNLYYLINGIKGSKFNDDLIFCGFFFRTSDWYPEVGLVGRLGSDGVFKWIKQIPEQWGNHHAGQYFMNILEASNGDIILKGMARGLQGPSSTWIMRLGPDGCVPDQMYCSGDSILIAHPDVMVSTQNPMEFPEEAIAFPNPVKRGDVITIQTTGESSPGEMSKLRWFSSSGEAVHTSSDNLLQVDIGYQMRVPDNLPGGIYILDLTAGKYSYRTKVYVFD